MPLTTLPSIVLYWALNANPYTPCATRRIYSSLTPANDWDMSLVDGIL